MTDNRRYTYYEDEKDKENIIDSYLKCIREKRRLDEYFENIITPYIKSKNLEIFDVCCGIGYVSDSLSKISPQSRFLGIDQTPYLIKEANKLFSHKKNLRFEIGDIYDLQNRFEKHFDISINWRCLSWIPYYDEMIKSLIKVTKNQIFVSSLFYEGNIDFEIKVREFNTERGQDHFSDYWNVYSLPKFVEFVYNQGAKNVEVYDFDIDIDIPQPPIDKMSSYTVKLDSGKRLQVCGTIILPWKIIRIDLQ